ncbi:MAG: cation:proton antiporter [Nitrosomonadales bacterium]
MTNSLQLLLILLATAVGVVVLCRILRLPAMLGYLIVGITIGPHAFGWIPDEPETRDLAEFGVVFLMFSIGLEFSLARLRAMQRLVFGLGTAQVVCTILLVMLASYIFGLDWRAGLALGGVLAMSSTAIVSKMLVEYGRTEYATWSENHGRAVVPGSCPWYRSLSLSRHWAAAGRLSTGRSDWRFLKRR